MHRAVHHALLDLVRLADVDQHGALAPQPVCIVQIDVFDLGPRLLKQVLIGICHVSTPCAAVP
jgi:hypothetical protein